MNMPRLAIEVNLENPHATDAEKTEAFRLKVVEKTHFIAEQLKARFEFQSTALKRQFKFSLDNEIWKGASHLNSEDAVGEVIKSGTLGIGFIGGHNAMVALFGEGHGTSQTALECLTKAVSEISRYAKKISNQHGLNFSALGTPAEGLSGRFTKLDQEKFGIIEGVNDRDYYVNSFHVDVKESITADRKIEIEAPFHNLCRGGHISYIELDGAAKKNLPAFVSIVKKMYDEGVGYGSLNHAIDNCVDCGYSGIINNECPKCGGENISRLRRICGYLTGSTENWNSYKQAEEKDRVKHSI